eukprot:CAMPEP_0194139406 /NCGR_PEP_ID=MMETSP0152-20130528/9039_1 /TAXON_ID=1049557 /ORGANISM="Thalassiothrix antarctica, Strain L6-D1" /LENGTH=403 /DNA_ID=CAMNT_0038837207 /DNA_START=21 /DNA_END=1232 /DNA_ORIENTATION=+
MSPSSSPPSPPSSRSSIVSSALRIFGLIASLAFAIIFSYPQPDIDWEGTILPNANRYMQTTSSSSPLNGLVIAVTGSTSGIGLGLTRKLSELGASVLAIGRSSSKLDSLFGSDKNIKTVLADLNDLESVANASHYILKEYNHLDILVNNAGLHTGIPGFGDYPTTKQGYEQTFGVNYLSHFLLTEKLLPLLTKKKNKKGKRSKIIQVSSSFHWGVDGTDLSSSSNSQPIASLPGGSHGFFFYRTQRQYANSKLAQIYHARSIRKNYSNVIAVSACPSWVGTRILGNSQWSYSIFSKLAFPSDGYGLHSIFNAILDVGSDDDDDFYVNNDSPLAVLADLMPSWTYSVLPIRDFFAQQFAMGLLLTQRFFPATSIKTRKSSRVSYNERIQDELYQWSKEAVSQWL